MWFSTHPVTVAHCDAVITSSEQGEVFLNGVIATADRCWVTLHIAAEQSGAHDAFNDVQTWNEESLIDFRRDASRGYDLRLSIDGVPTGLSFARGNGGGIDEEAHTMRWTQNLSFPFDRDQQVAVLDLQWSAMNLSGSHRLDLVAIAEAVRDGAY